MTAQSTSSGSTAENFFTLKQADLLYGPWAEQIPNSKFVNWDNPALNLDFGRPVDGYESPWSGAQFHFIYDSARMAEEDCRAAMPS